MASNTLHEKIDVPGVLRRYGLRPDKRLGQNFLVDASLLQRVVEAASIQPGEIVLEIGPGLGSLTRLLAEKASRVVAVELDGRLIPPLEEALAGCSNVRLVLGDILDFDPAVLVKDSGPGQNDEAPPLDYVVVGNIPYYITSALMRHLMEASRSPSRLALTVQREVAERICAEPGGMSLLSLSVQVYGKARVAARIPAGAFYPSPKVDSAVVRIDVYSQPVISRSLIPVFFRLAKAGFSHKRKTLRNALSGGMRWTPEKAAAILGVAGIDEKRRAQTLSLEEWGRLAEIVHSA